VVIGRTRTAARSQVGDGVTADGSAAVGGFAPSTHAFAFANVFPRRPVLRVALPGLGRIPIGDASRGLCGGMIYTVRDLFEAGLRPPPETVPPAEDSPLYGYIVRRLFDSFDIPTGVARFYRLMASPDADSARTAPPSRGLGRVTAVDEWPRVRLDLDRGVLSPLGVIVPRSLDPFQLGINHQVLAYAYTQTGTGVTLRVYDPNTPPERGDDVTLSFDVARPGTGMPISHNLTIGGRPVRGFFRSRYRFRSPRGVFREA
jgi:hypothetical protein